MPLPADFEQMFELAPVSLWLNDFSGLKQLFDRWRTEGVTDLRDHLAADPARVVEGVASLRILQVNRRTLALFGAASQHQLLGQLQHLFRDDSLDHMVEEWLPLWEGELAFSNQTVNYTLEGTRLDVLVQGRVLPGHESRWDRVMVSLDDVTARVAAAGRLHASERHARDLFEHSPVSLWVEDFSAVRSLLEEVRDNGIDDFTTFIKVHPEFVSRCMQEIRVVDVNQQTLRMFGAPDKAALLNGLASIFRGEMQDSFAEQLRDLWHGKTTQQREVVNYSLAGDLINIYMQFAVLADHRATWDLVLVSLTDITARKKAEAYLEYLGKHDVLTKLRNRAFYAEELNRLTRKGPWPVCVIAIDLNGLKRINDEQGHAAGDAVLRRAGEVLGKAVDLPACAARIGGDEFAVLLPGLDERAAQGVRGRIDSLLELNNAFYAGQVLSMAMGVGACASGDQLEAALQRADQAMYEEKANYYAEQSADRRRRAD